MPVKELLLLIEIVGDKLSNRSIIGAAPRGEETCGVAGEESDFDLSNEPTDGPLFLLVDIKSDVEKLFCTGVVPMDKRSNRTSVPLVGACSVPFNKKDQNPSTEKPKIM